MMTKIHFPVFGAALGLALIPSSAHAAAIITDGQTVSGTTTNLNLSLTASPSGIRPTAGNATLSNSSGNLLFTPNNASGDYFVTWGGLSINTNTYRYAQVTFSAVTVGAVSAGWQTFFDDGDSDIGAPSNSGHGIGTGTVGTVPFSVVIDMVALTGASGGSTGATGWGDTGTDIVTALRFDMFENTTNNGKTFTISEVKLGSALIPEPSSALLGGLGVLCLLRRRR